MALSVQFATLGQFKNVYAGGLWERFKDRYPRAEEKQPINATFETFGLPQPQPEFPEFQFVTEIGALRYWFVSEDDRELLQFQSDRIVHNWRKISADQVYPRYEQLRDKFRAEIDEVQAYLSVHKLGEIKVNQCEVTYINHISFGEDADSFASLDRIFMIWSDQYSDSYLPSLEAGRFNVSYVVQDDGKPLGRLHITAQPAVHRQTKKPIVQLTIVARGKPTGETVGAALEWLDRGRVAVVRGFTSITRPEMHRRWGRKHDNQ